MNEIVFLNLLLVFGFVAGIFVGMLGIGGGVLFVPLLYILLPYTAVDQSSLSYIVLGTSVFAGSIGAISAGSRHFYLQNVDRNKAVLLISGSALAAGIAPLFVVRVGQTYLQIIFGVVFLLLSAKMLLESSGRGLESKYYNLNSGYLVLFGFLIGWVAAFSGIGGGVLFVPILLYLYSSDIKKAVGTSSVVTAFTMISSSAGFLLQNPAGQLTAGQYGYTYIAAGLPLGIGSALGAILGVKLISSSSEKTIKKIFSMLLIMVIVKIIFDI